MIQIKYEPENSRAAAYDKDKNIGESTYSKSEAIWIIDHTLVDEGYGGQGIAGKLVAEIVAQARVAGVKILPLCPFAKREFEKRPEYADVAL
ncbi:GNAT family N-acetyltransferase [uncultured Veillonella sp.]|uniref:GNAT family N-acetyltransferase n=1 Tax=uncultured Veillonella sp. TaxID=159268 RepID=UPI00263475B2|nr:GNAT family N-acetyltransferase [uncultured Veillonella sp.]